VLPHHESGLHSPDVETRPSIATFHSAYNERCDQAEVAVLQVFSLQSTRFSTPVETCLRGQHRLSECPADPAFSALVEGCRGCGQVVHELTAMGGETACLYWLDGPFGPFFHLLLDL
jgi:hypothetical protein